jgi:hypothetical protein
MLQRHGWYQRIHVFPDAALSVSGYATAKINATTIPTIG